MYYYYSSSLTCISLLLHDYVRFTVINLLFFVFIFYLVSLYVYPYIIYLYHITVFILVLVMMFEYCVFVLYMWYIGHIAYIAYIPIFQNYLNKQYTTIHIYIYYAPNALCFLNYLSNHQPYLYFVFVKVCAFSVIQLKRIVFIHSLHVRFSQPYLIFNFDQIQSWVPHITCITYRY